MNHAISPERLKRISKFMSLVLRHQPEKIGLILDAQGWAETEDLIQGLNAQGLSVDRATLERVVRENDKQRFALSEDGSRIRASQGHSIEIELAYSPEAPPEYLYHGTTGSALKSIRAEGLQKRKRHHVHLSQDAETARAVGMRHGPPVILTIRAGEMARQGHSFYRSANGVWLVEAVPPEFIQFKD